MSYSSEVLADSPQLFWRFQETSGTVAADSSGQSHPGTYTNNPTLNQTLSPIGSDAAARSVLFDGSDDKVTSSYAAFTGQKSFEGWAYRTSSTSVDTLFSGSGGVAMLRIPANSTDVQWFTDTGAASTNWVAAWPGNNLWVHWVLEHDEGAHTSRLRINNVDLGVQNFVSTYNAGPGNFQVAVRGGSTEPWGGNLAEIAIYPVLLGSSRTAAHFQAAGTGVTSDSYWTIV